MTNFRNKAIESTVTIFAVALAIAGCSHGFFEMLQGFKPTPSIGIDSVGPELGLWGEDPAFTLIPNYLITGAIAFLLGLVIIVWAIKFLDTNRAVPVLLALFVLQTLAGGGVGYIPFYLILCAWATRMDKPLSGLARLPAGLRGGLAVIWKPLAITGAILWVLALAESILGITAPTIGDQNTLYLVWTMLLAVLVLMQMAFIGAGARDLKNRN